MKRHFPLVTLVFFALLAASVVAASAEDGGCNLQGSWISYDANGVPTWMSTVYGQSNSSGTTELEYPAAFPKIPDDKGGVYFQDAVGMTQLRGAWERTGGNTFKYTFIGYGYDENGVPLWIGRMSAPITLSKEDCNTGTFGAALYGYTCADVDGAWKCPDPYGEPSFEIPIPDSSGYRVTVE